MKCPKCHYLSFDPEPRCRNCGYTLSLDPDLEIHPSEPAAADDPLGDLALRDDRGVRPAPPEDAGGRPSAARRPAPGHVEPARRPRTTTPGPFDEALSGAGADGRAAAGESPLFLPEQQPSPPSKAQELPPPPEEVRTRRPAPPATAELPLFVRGLGAEPTPVAPVRLGEADTADHPDDLPLVAPPVAPVPPLAVRRPGPDSPGRARRGSAEPNQKLGPLDRDLLEGLQRIEHAEQLSAAADLRRGRIEHAVDGGRRLAAAAIDGLLLGLLTLGVVSMTLRWTDLTWNQLNVLPVVPLTVLILLIVIGYLFIFTAASGQTGGKMAMGLRVVDAASDAGGRRISVRQALYRGVLTIPSVLLLGAGFIPALRGDGRAVHDRLAETRVVRS